MSTLAALIQTFQDYDAATQASSGPSEPSELAELAQRRDPRLRKRQTCATCGACASDLYDAFQQVQKQKNLTVGLQRLLDMERADHDKLKLKEKAAADTVANLERESQDLKAELAQRELEYQALRQHMQEIAAEATKARAEMDRPESQPRKRAKMS